MKTNKLEKLFELLCDDFSRMLSDKEMTAPDRKLLIEFFKDNDISCVGSNNQNIQNIIEKLPFNEELEHSLSVNH
jgi:hypothetical protein